MRAQAIAAAAAAAAAASDEIYVRAVAGADAGFADTSGALWVIELVQVPLRARGAGGARRA